MRVGFNPNKDKQLEKSNYNHQVIVPVYIPNQEGYFKDSFQILQYCLESLFKTSHSKTYFTIVNNGSCVEIINYLNQLYQENKIHEVIHTTSIGKINAILKGLTGYSFELITITDADVLFLNDWQKATYEVFEAFPKTGAVSTSPSSKVLKQSTANLIVEKLTSSNLKFTNVVNPNAMQMFASSIGNSDFYAKIHLEKNLTISNSNTSAVVGAAHFVTTYKGFVFETLKSRFSTFALGGISENSILDKPVNDLGYWRLSTTQNYTFHMGNVNEDWMKLQFDKIQKASSENYYKQQKDKKKSSNLVFFRNLIFSFLSKKPIWKLFLRYKGLTKEEANQY